LALIDREGSYYYYLSLTPRVSLPPSPQSAIQVSMSMDTILSMIQSLKYNNTGTSAGASVVK